MKEYRICSRCIMDNIIAPEIIFDNEGVCNFCKEFDTINGLFGYKKGVSDNKFNEIINRIKKEGKEKKYDCIIGISGGVDSCYLAYLAKINGLRPLCVHVDSCFDSEVAKKNLHKLDDKLLLNIKYINVDEESICELQKSFFKSGIENVDIPQDHLYIASVYKCAEENNIKYLLNGINVATEGITHCAGVGAATDFTFIKDIYKKNGSGKDIFNKYPHLTLFEYLYLNRKIVKVNLLNYVDYSKNMAINKLHEICGWEYYGSKHWESVLTRFIYEYYLIKRFNYCKRRLHDSCLILGGEMTRKEALKDIERSIYTDDLLKYDKNFIYNKLNLTDKEMDYIINSENKNVKYKDNKNLLLTLLNIRNFLIRIFK